MRFASLLALLSIAVSCIAQSEKPCSAGPAVTLSDRDGVTEKVLSFSGSFGTRSAHVFLPHSRERVPGIVFSQSAIQYEDSQTDVIPFARALARVGAASIVIDGTIDWHTPNDDFKRPRKEFNCAAKWLAANVSLDPERLALGGPIKFGGEPIDCPEDGPVLCEAWIYVNYGWNEPMAVRATKLMKTVHGQLEITRLVTGSFHLKDVEPAWLLENAPPATQAGRSMPGQQ